MPIRTGSTHSQRVKPQPFLSININIFSQVRIFDNYVYIELIILDIHQEVEHLNQIVIFLLNCLCFNKS